MSKPLAISEFITSIKPELEELESFRQHTYRRNRIATIVSVGIGIPATGAFIYGFLKGYVPLGFTGFILLVSTGVYAKVTSDFTYKTRVKEEIITKLVKARYPSLKYYPKKEWYDDFKVNRVLLSKGNYSTIIIKDVIEGTYKNVHIRLAELETRESSDKAGDMFVGLYAEFDFNKYFNGETFIIHDSFFNPINYMNSMGELVSQEYEVKLEHPEFREKFDVYSTDQVEARYILSTSLIERIMKLAEEHRGEMKMLFKGGKLTLSINNFHDYFRVVHKKSILDTVIIKDFLTEIELVVGLVDDLKLNEKLWSKK